MIAIAAAAAGMVLFALCAHQGAPWKSIAFAGLMLTGAAMGFAGGAPGLQTRGGPGSKDPGLPQFSLSTIAFTVAGVGIGAGGGLLHRYGLGLPLIPSTGVEWFVIVACLIGAAEELVYRGFVFGQARAFGWPAAVVIAAVTHAAYKTALFAWPASPIAVNLWEVAWITTAAGIMLGLLRAWSGSVLPCVAAHVVFDFVVYRGLADAPWWVWR